jgi:hypothetical protein
VLEAEGLPVASSFSSGLGSQQPPDQTRNEKTHQSNGYIDHEESPICIRSRWVSDHPGMPFPPGTEGIDRTTPGNEPGDQDDEITDGLHRSNVIYHRLDSSLPGTVGAAEERPLCFDAMTHDSASAMIADRSELMDGTLEAVEGMGLAGGDDLKREIVVVPANFASSHGVLPDQGSAACLASTRRVRSAGLVPRSWPVGLT